MIISLKFKILSYDIVTSEGFIDMISTVNYNILNYDNIKSVYFSNIKDITMK